MKLKQVWQDGQCRLAIESQQGWIDVTAESSLRGVKAPVTMLELIRSGADGMAVLKQLTENPQCFTDAPTAPAVTGGEKILCIGFNYRRHAKEFNQALPTAPTPFNKFPDALAADGDSIYLDPRYVEYDYEAELVAVIGKTARNVRAEEALDYVFGYTCGNDLSTRDLQFVRTNQWLLSKTFDGFAPLGPCVVTADSIDPDNLNISSVVNGELRQNSNTSYMVFSTAQIIADLSSHFTLKPGDLIFTGTPEGVMKGYPEDQKNCLKPGDSVDVTIENIGTLHNTFR